jgi:uncharacterized protein YdiU (UPF0061 family)
MADKLGLKAFREGDEDLIGRLFALMEGQVDFTLFFRALSDSDDGGRLRDMFVDRDAFDDWLDDFSARLGREQPDDEARRSQMRATNPKYILRNYLAQQAIAAAERGDYSEIETLNKLLQNPFDEQAEFGSYAQAPPDWAQHIELSCSS